MGSSTAYPVFRSTDATAAYGTVLKIVYAPV
jgi:hypothetical protein